MHHFFISPQHIQYAKRNAIRYMKFVLKEISLFKSSIYTHFHKLQSISVGKISKKNNAQRVQLKGNTLFLSLFQLSSISVCLLSMALAWSGWISCRRLDSVPNDDTYREQMNTIYNILYTNNHKPSYDKLQDSGKLKLDFVFADKSFSPLLYL